MLKLPVRFSFNNSKIGISAPPLLLNKDEVFIVDDQLVVGLLHSANKCKAKDLSTISNNEMTGKFCAFKNQIPTDKLNMGMGDIFIKMAR